MAIWQVWTGKRAEIGADSGALSASLDIWVLLCGGFHVYVHQALSTDCILVQGKVEEGLFLVQIAPAFSVFKREGGQNVLKSI